MMEAKIHDRYDIDVLWRKRRKTEPVNNPITGREYRRMLKKAWFSFGISLGINIVMAIALYIAQAGPF